MERVTNETESKTVGFNVSEGKPKSIDIGMSISRMYNEYYNERLKQLQLEIKKYNLY